MGRYFIKKVPTGFTFYLEANNHETIINSSEAYTTKAACEKGIDSIRKNAPIAPVEDLTSKKSEKCTNPKFEIYLDAADEFRFRLKARNGENIAKSEGYTQKANCKNGIESVRKNADSPVEMLEEK